MTGTPRLSPSSFVLERRLLSGTAVPVLPTPLSSLSREHAQLGAPPSEQARCSDVGREVRRRLNLPLSVLRSEVRSGRRVRCRQACVTLDVSLSSFIQRRTPTRQPRWPIRNLRNQFRPQLHCVLRNSYVTQTTALRDHISARLQQPHSPHRPTGLGHTPQAASTAASTSEAARLTDFEDAFSDISLSSEALSSSHSGVGLAGVQAEMPPLPVM